MAVDPFGFKKGMTRSAALTIFLGSGAALIGLVILVVGWMQLAVATMAPDSGTADPCVVAYEDKTAGADVSFHVLPPKSVCVWTVDGERTTVVLNEQPAALAWSAAAVTLLGVGSVVGALVYSRRMSHRAATMDE